MNICLTLDYELYLNDNTGSVDNCLVRPMLKLLDVCREMNVKLTVFVDASYLVRMKELSPKYPSLNQDYQRVVENIRLIKSQGHAIELHVHPQWFYSDFDGEKWIVDFNHYKLSDMPMEDSLCRFRDCKVLLESIIDDKVIGFRAGGYSLQTFQYIKEAFTENNIGYDSSVLRGAKVSSPLHYYDYRKAPKESYYRFSDNIIQRDNNGDFIEFPIDTKSFCIANFLLRKRAGMKKYVATNQNYGDGGDNPHGSKLTKLCTLIKKFAFKRVMSGNIDYQSFFFMEDVYKAKLKMRDSDLFVMIAHPKNFSDASINHLQTFINKHKTNINFISLTDIYNTMSDQVR